MKSKKVKRWLSVLLATAMMTGVMAGCGSEQQQGTGTQTSDKTTGGQQETQATEEAVQVTYPIEGNVTLTLAMVGESVVTSSGATDLFETPFGKAWQEQTGVTIEVIQLADDDAMNLLFAGGELPDLIYYQFGSKYTGGAAKAIKDKIIEPLNDYVEYLPDMMEALESNPDFIKQTTTDEGKIIGGPFVRGDDMLKTSAGIIIRQDWMDELGLEAPETPDEVYEVLKAFKEEKGAEVPLTFSSQFGLKTLGLNHGILTGAFGLPKCDFYQENGTVHYGFYEQEYKEVLTWLNKLYQDGLLDPNFQTIDNTSVAANMLNGEAGMTIGANGGFLGSWLNTMAETDAEYDLAGISPLVAKKGDTPMSTHFDNATNGWYLVMTPTCSNKEAAAQFINYGYTEEGSLLFNFGIEGESYTMENGYPTYTDLIMNNPEGLTAQQAMAQYQRAWYNGPFVQRKEYIEQYYVLEQQKEALKAWSNSNAAEYQMPNVVIADADAAELSKLTADINTYIDEMMVKYISGLVSLDTFETEYLPTLQSMGIERVIEIYQDGLDRYNAR